MSAESDAGDDPRGGSGDGPLWMPSAPGAPQPPAGQPANAGGPVFVTPGQLPGAAGGGGPVFVKPPPAEGLDDERPWGWYVGPVAIFVALFLVSIVQLAGLAAIASVMSSHPTIEDLTDQYEHWVGIAQDVLWIATALVVPFLFARHLKPGELGMRRPPSWWKAVGVFAAVIFLFYLFAALYSSIAGLDEQSNTLLDTDSGFGDSVVRDVAYALLYTVAAPVAEELLFRGLLFRSLRDGFSRKLRRTAPWIAAVLSGVIFGAIHYSPAVANQNKFIPVLMALGILLALAYNFSGTIYVNILIHSVNNAIATGANTHPTQDWVFVLIGVGPVIALLTTFGLSRFVSAVFRSERPNSAHPPSAEPAIV